MAFLLELLGWFTDSVNWSGSDGIPSRMWEHVWYSAFTSAVAIAVAVPIGLWVGHTGRGGELAINLSNPGRAIPSFGILVLGFGLLGFGYAAGFIPLIALALPPIVTNTYVGVRNVDPEVRDSAEGMGLTGWQVLRRVEVPVAMPLIMAGVRTAVVQLVATTTLAAFIGLGGLGRFIIDGFAQQDYANAVAGAILVALLALATEYLLGRLQTVVVPTGLQARMAQANVEAKVGPARSGAGT